MKTNKTWNFILAFYSNAKIATLAIRLFLKPVSAFIPKKTTAHTKRWYIILCVQLQMPIKIS